MQSSKSRIAKNQIEFFFRFWIEIWILKQKTFITVRTPLLLRYSEERVKRSFNRAKVLLICKIDHACEINSIRNDTFMLKLWKLLLTFEGEKCLDYCLHSRKLLIFKAHINVLRAETGGFEDEKLSQTTCEKYTSHIDGTVSTALTQ